MGDAETARLARMANAIRALTMDAVEAAKSGHPGMPMGMADAAATLFARHAKIDPADPSWPDRDRFVLSAGHGSMLQYAVHHLMGYADMPIEELKAFRQLGRRTAGHPEYGHALGIETTTGPLGQGLATAVGMAIAERAMNARFGDGLVDHRTYVIAGDGCLMEGISHEAADLAGTLRLGRLIVMWDDNGITIDGKVSLSSSADQEARFAALGWHVIRADGHDPADVDRALEEAKADPRPSLIACRTVIGKGAPTKAGGPGIHGAPLGPEEIAATRDALGWEAGPFAIPEDVAEAWAAVPARAAAERMAWAARRAASPDRAAFDAAVAMDLSAVEGAIRAHKKALSAEAPTLATRVASQKALDAIRAATPLLMGGSADLTGSNNTKAKGQAPISAEDFRGDYIHYGIREFGMAAAMNGIALHGGFTPYGGAFLAFADYARGAIRLSALMGVRAVYVMTHDSIGLGEDGPTHQPVEHVASLRAIPNLAVFRPCDAVETAEAWEAALRLSGPSVLCLSRQGLPVLRRTHEDENLAARGAYVLREPAGGRDATILATGSEVEVACAAADLLAAEGIRAAVVSMPCWELFAERPETEQASVLGDAPRVAVEAAIRFGWDAWIGPKGGFTGMEGFGASAPAPDLYQHFGITPEAVAASVRAAL
ncbi:transketolase [Rhodovulum sp. DZ06]|uniref:transketolase n=1 Tax=Rhodovulum sp. DZ06 TaxID=3425126 RepID=UPI003D32C481